MPLAVLVRLKKKIENFISPQTLVSIFAILNSYTTLLRVCINMIFLTFTYSHTPIDKHFMNFLTISRRFDFIWTNIHLLRRNFLKHFSIIFFFLEYFSPFVSALFWKFAWVTGVSRCFEKYYLQNFGIFVNFLVNFGSIYQKSPKRCKQINLNQRQINLKQINGDKI